MDSVEELKELLRMEYVRDVALEKSCTGRNFSTVFKATITTKSGAEMIVESNALTGLLRKLPEWIKK